MESLGIGRRILQILKAPSFVKIKSYNLAQRKAVCIYSSTQKPQRRLKKSFHWLRQLDQLRAIQPALLD